LSQGALLAIERHGSDSLREMYLDKLASGEWTGTMCLTEPQAGSDLAAITTRAVPKGDHYLLTGRKIFITWGDHAMTDNIVHLVLARLPDAPQGTKGISLFAVPKYRLRSDRSRGERNDVHPVSVEHKLGIHASPTCVMAFGDRGGAEGHLIGQPHEGLAAMFTMMNYMRLGVGVQGMGVAERSYQRCVAFARERLQGKAPGERGRVAIIRHPDVRRMLLTMRALTQASRAICYYTASCLDRASHGTDASVAAAMQARADLLTPIAKAWCTEAAQESTSLGIQAGDLIGRKVLRDGGATVAALVSEMRSVDAPLANAGDAFAGLRSGLSRGLDEIVQASTFVLTGEKRDPDLPGAVAMNYLMLLGTVIGGWQVARGALAANAALEASSSVDKGFMQTQLVLARFYAEHVLPRAAAYGATIRAGSASVMALTPEQF
jgi:acyl-CoA dehydrogenase